MSTSFIRSHKALTTIAALVLVGGGAWGVVTFARDKGPTIPKELTAEALQAKANEDPGKVFEQVHQAMERTDLTEEQRHAIRENARTVFEAQMDKRMNEYFAATPQQRNAVLDRHIAEMQSRMKEFEQRRAQLGGGPDGRPGGSAAGTAGGGAPAGGRPQAGPPVGGPGPGRPGEARDGRRPEPTREQRKMFTEARDPDKSARRMAYFTAMRQRAEEKGIQMPSGRGPR